MQNTKSKVTVGMIIPGFYPLPMGGAELQAFALSKRLLNEGVKVKVITSNIGNLPEYEVFQGIEVFRTKSLKSKVVEQHKARPAVKIDYTNTSENNTYATEKKSLKIYSGFVINFILFFKCIWKLRKTLDVLQISMITNYTVIINVIGWLLGIPVVVKDSTYNGIGKMHQCPFKKVSRAMLIKNANFVAMTSDIKAKYEKWGIEENKISFIPNGVDFENKQEIKRDKFGKRFLFVGNLYQQPAKGIDILLYAWAKVLETDKQVELTIIGDGDLASYEKFAEELKIAGNVRFLGKKDPVKYYHENDCFILPSRREGLSNALLEAISCKMPAIVSNISGNNDVVEDNITGYIFERGNISDLAAKILLCLRNDTLNIQMGQKAFTRLLDRGYSINEVTKKYAKLYDGLLSA